MAAPTAWPIQFVSGAKPGVERKINQIKSEIETKEKRKKYEQDKRPARTFNIKWQVGRDWLVFDADHNDMKCRLCIDYHARSGKQDNLKQKHLFVTGCTNFHTSTIVDHEKSQMHEYAVSLSLAARAPEKTPAYKSLLAINQHNRKIISYKFRNVHAVIKHNRPFSDYVWLNQCFILKYVGCQSSN
jgi:hypothetical protein